MDRDTPLRHALVVCSLFAITSCSTEIQTTHYTAVFDPQQQVMQELYRVNIVGEASWYTDVQYASGWVAAAHADLITRSLKHDETRNVSVTQTDTRQNSIVRSERNFYEIGPLGIATQPSEDRFVVVMGANPDYFFKKVATLASAGRDFATQDSVMRVREMILAEVRQERAIQEEELRKLKGK